MTTDKKRLAETIKYNARVLSAVEDATAFRIAYKTPNGWKRLIVPFNAEVILREAAAEIVEERLDTLVPLAAEIVINKALDKLVDDLAVDDVEVILRGVC